MGTEEDGPETKKVGTKNISQGRKGEHEKHIAGDEKVGTRNISHERKGGHEEHIPEDEDVDTKYIASRG